MCDYGNILETSMLRLLMTCETYKYGNRKYITQDKTYVTLYNIFTVGLYAEHLLHISVLVTEHLTCTRIYTYGVMIAHGNKNTLKLLWFIKSKLSH